MSLEKRLSSVGKLLDHVFIRCADFFRTLFFSSRSERSARRHQNSAPYVILLFDSFIAFLSIFISIHLRIGMDFLDYSPIYIVKNMFVFGLVSSSVFLWLQTHQSFWRYTSVEDMAPIFLSVVLSNIIFFPLMLLMNQEDFLPYSVLVINIFVLFFTLIIPRFITRILYNNRINSIKRVDSLTSIEERRTELPEILLVGRASSVDIFLGEVISNDDIQFNFEPVGILTVEQSEVGRAVRGVPIISDVRAIGQSISDLAREGIFPRQIMITEKSMPENMRRHLLKYVHEHGMLLMHVFHQCTFNTVTE